MLGTVATIPTHNRINDWDAGVYYSIFIGKITIGIPNLKNLF